MASGMEIAGLIATVANVLGRAVRIVENVRAAPALSAKNKPLCDALTGQLGALTIYVEGMQCNQAAELDALGPVWAGAFGQLAVDVAAVEKELRRLASPKRRSNALAQKASELKHAVEALQFAEAKLGVSRVRNQSVALAVIEQVLDLEEGLLSMARVIDILKAAVVPARSPEEARIGRHGQEHCRSGTADNRDEILGVLFDYEDERKKLEELQPRLVRFWRRMERGKTGRRMSAEERRDMAALMQLLWAPWKLDRSSVKASSGYGVLGSGTFGAVSKGTLALKCGKTKVAVKVMQRAFSQGEFKADFFREASMLHRLRHPAIVAFYGAWWPDAEMSPGSDDNSATGSDESDADANSSSDSSSHSSSDSSSDSASSDDGGSWPEVSAAFVMERLDGNVGDLVDRGAISAREDLWSVFVDSAQGLLHLHEHGVMHLDVKPENILACVAGGASGRGLVGRAKLTDFGVSRRKQDSEASRSTRANQRQPSTRRTESGVGVVGTLAFMAPEILSRSDRARREAAGDGGADVGAPGHAQLESGGAGLSFACDVYSLGITICRVMQLRMARAGKRVYLPAIFLGSEGELAAAARSGVLVAAVQRWVKEVLWEEAEMVLRDLVLACVQGRPCDRPSMATVLAVLNETRSMPGEPPGCGSLGAERTVGLREKSAANIYALGVAYRYGTGVCKDVRKAISLLSRSADGGDVPALASLAGMYDTGVGVAKDFAKARELYQCAADGGDMGAVNNLGQMYEDGKGVAMDFAKARELYQRAADTGDMGAVNNLGQMYENGKGVAKDFSKARELYQRAADGGRMGAFNRLGLMYELGKGLAVDFAKACELYQRAADGGDMSAVYNLADMYEDGKGVAMNFAKARELYQRAADSGDMDAVNNLGQMYENGKGVAKDFSKARELYQRAADGGSMSALHNLGYMYEDGKGVAKDFAKACELYQRAADGGRMGAVNSLGLMYENGKGVAVDFAKACELYQRAADGGDMNAVHNLGDMYYNGMGVTKDFAKACELYQRAADGGDMDAVNNLGLMYENGEGVAKDFVKARERYQRATDGGCMAAVFSLGLMYYSGIGVAKDFVKARELYQRAADSGHIDAVHYLGCMYASGKGVTKDFAKARELLQRAADGGSMGALKNLGSLYEYGDGVAKDFSKARELYQRAADGGSMSALHNLGYMYEDGKGVAKDFAKACELYQRAADGGRMGAVNSLGLMYELGKGVAVDFAKACELYQRAADGGDMAAVYYFGVMYEHGKGVAKDLAKARELYQRAADDGIAQAAARLSAMK